ncbi:Holliday junction branch migration DNA helicase RuvB [Leptospira perolatii]|uniref:Holliday junction branch migration complex subunit RuvB n=1 Tax=Leptospira perolatii TaxID=2023191 RepID=A0A2M9ZNB7_9LEPT|nr:Holliday junction branch migration DNA helicase RuvB [Leptospira perolatii]PJZ69579.1 Holliday junction branch migration DNA helicase RuvB [Leptospira perolatii]PJZ73566.1 Holliday junction branch migration DNA helicase RuvB [Leptospira perolatii]
MASHTLNPEEKFEEEATLRPSLLSEFVGQREILSNLGVFIEAAKKRGEAMDHVLLSGPPGLGKTTLAGIISQELGSRIIVTSAPVLSRGADLAKLLTELNERDILFIDEIHSLNRKLEEILYPAMENYMIDLLVGEGITAQTIQIKLKPFTLVGATTRSGLISDPLKSRFGIHFRLDYYNDEEMRQIVLRSSKILGYEIDSDAAFEIGKRSRKTPRIANHLLKRVRDFSQVQGEKSIGTSACDKAFQRLGIDEHGLDKMDRQILECMIDRYNGGPVGLKPIAAVIGEEERTLEDHYESYMVRIGLINRTPSGRIATEKAYKILEKPYSLAGKKLDSDASPGLF